MDEIKRLGRWMSDAIFFYLAAHRVDTTVYAVKLTSEFGMYKSASIYGSYDASGAPSRPLLVSNKRRKLVSGGSSSSQN